MARLQGKLSLPRTKGKKGSKVPIDWDAEDEEAFQKNKQSMCSELVLQRMNPDKPFVVRTDASHYAVGAVLEQMADGDGGTYQG